MGTGSFKKVFTRDRVRLAKKQKEKKMWKEREERNKYFILWPVNFEILQNIH